jgi:membrane protein YqaA with SNARE-associated domain
MIVRVLLVFFVVFFLNLVPAFAPPTWMVFSFIGFAYPQINVVVLALVGAVSATLGRATLAKLARVIVRGRLLSQRSKESIDAIKERLEQRRKLTFGVFLLYAFSPLPSNYLFIAYGLTTMDLALIAVPFFIGRSISYSFWGVTSSVIGRHLNGTLQRHPLGYLSLYFIVTQIALLYGVYLFTRVDWRYVLDEKKFRWLPRNANNSPNNRSV